MKINWFPGHMKKALDSVNNNLKLVNCLIYVLDARAPISCLNPKLKTIIGNKPIIYVLSKSDLADESQNIKWKRYFSQTNSLCITLDSRNNSSVKKMSALIFSLCNDIIEKNKSKSLNTTIRAMVVGVPNTGKSTIINSLCGKAKAITGNRPGVTRGNQWVKINNDLELLDTPGTLWPNLDNQKIATNLCYIGSIKDEVVEINDLSYSFVKDMSKKYPDLLATRYEIELNPNDEPLEIINKICLSRGFLLKNKEYDYDRCCKAIIDDFRKGRIGKITLEKYEEFGI